MDMINQILPFYNSIEKRDKARYNSNEVRYCPRWNLLPFLIKRAHSATSTVLTAAYLVDCAGTETEITNNFLSTNYPITSWTNYTGTYAPTFTAVAGAVTIVDAASGGTAVSNNISIVTGKIYKVQVWLAYTSGEYPVMKLVKTSDLSLASNEVTLAQGLNTFYLTATQTVTGALVFINTAATNFALGTPDIRLLSIGTFYNYTSVDYWQYLGTTLDAMLPVGRYYLKVTDGVGKWYSEWFDVRDIYFNECTGWTNSGGTPVTDLQTSGADITLFDEQTSTGRCYANTMTVANTEVIKIVFKLTHIGGQMPTFNGYESPGAADIVTGDGACVAGINEFTFTCTKSSLLTCGFNVTAVSKFSISSFIIKRTGANGYTKVTFTNSVDLSDILYQHSFIQNWYCPNPLLQDDPKQISTGSERQGVFIAESVITLPKFKLIDWVSPSLLRVLKMIQGHGTITVTDEKGTAYTPDNIEMTAEANGYDLYKVEISFTDSEIINTLNQANIT